MKAPDFLYERPKSLDAALARLAEGDGSVEPLAGGQSLMPMMNFRMAAPETLLDLNGLSELSGIRREGETLVIGATTRWRMLEVSDEVAKAAPLLAKALPHIAHPAIRNRGTPGGSVALADPAAELPALLLALDGEIVLKSAKGERVVAARDFFLGVYETAREEDELVVALRIPVAKDGQRFGFHEIVRRHGDYAMAGSAVAVSADRGTVRVAFFGVADRAIRADGAEAALAGGKADLEAAVNSLQVIDFEGDSSASSETKRHLAGVALRRAWAEAMA